MNLKPTHKIIKDYYTELEEYKQLGITHEGAVSTAFQKILEPCGRKHDWKLVAQHRMTSRKRTQISVDGAFLDKFRIPRGYWEAKDMHDDLPTEVKRKFDAGYPNDNIIFQTPERAILWQNNLQILDANLNDNTQLIEALQTFFAYAPPEYLEWEKAVEDFKKEVPQLGQSLGELIRQERESNRTFATAFVAFLERCRQSLNPNLSEEAVEEMLIQHLLTERIFRTVFSNPDFIHRNVIAREIEIVIKALTSESFSRDDFLRSLDRFYVAIERNAVRISDFSEKQGFLNAVYEQFFQGFSVKVADTHGIVYTPQPIVDFMVQSVEHILATEFNRSLSDSGVNIIDPFVGTGNFIVRIMQEIRKSTLEHKYTEELHCNEVMLLPYYIASMNIEHQFYEMTGRYQPFERICLVDTFDLKELRQRPLFARENAVRVERQKETPMFVVIGNPPYNMGQVNENDNNKNRKYRAMADRIAETYAKDSTATLKSHLYDPYVKAISWASDQIRDEGIVAFVTNSGFLDGLAFDGMRKHLATDFDAIFIVDLGGNARKGLKISDSNVFGIRVGVSINFFVKTKRNRPDQTRILYHRTDESWDRTRKFEFLNQNHGLGTIKWSTIEPGERYTWLTEGIQSEFKAFVPIGTKEAKNANGSILHVIFKTYSNGVITNRDAWAYNFNRNQLFKHMSVTIDVYNSHVLKWLHRKGQDSKRPDPEMSSDDSVVIDPVDAFVSYDEEKISWSSSLKQRLKAGRIATFEADRIRRSLYRPYTKSNLYFDRLMNDRVCVFPSIFPTPQTETENRIILVKVGKELPMFTLMSNMIPDRQPQSGSQCFPFYTYDEDGSNRRENITDWALAQFCSHYGDKTITKWNIFHYVYAMLHHAEYGERYAANLMLELPRMPYAPDFWGFTNAGARLAEIHVGYEDVEEYQGGNGAPILQLIETPGVPLDWRVEKMKLSKDKTQLKYNDYLTLDGIPSKAYDYQLGNRSALEWVIDQYRVKTDKRSGIDNDPNRDDDPQYIIRLIRKVITVSLETVEIVENLPEIGVR